VVEVNGFKYRVDQNGIPKIKHSKEIPKKLYKYYSLDENSVDALLSGYLFASHPYHLNDHADSGLSLIDYSKKPSFDFFKALYSNFPFNYSVKKVFNLYEQTEDGSIFLQNLYPRLFYDKGIISLSQNEYSDLMWPHYTKEEGFQLEFNVKGLIDSIENNLSKQNQLVSFHPINYSKQRRVITFTEKLEKHPVLALLYITSIKDFNWSYENEWRIIVSNGAMGIPWLNRGYVVNENSPGREGARKIFYDGRFITGITLGANFLTHNSYYLSKFENGSMVIRPRKNKRTTISFLNYLSKIKNTPIYHSELQKVGFETGLKVKRLKRRIKVEKLAIEKFRVSFTKELFDEKGPLLIS
jgi:hypothetical protein